MHTCGYIRRLWTAFALCCCTTLVIGQVTFRISSLPEGTPDNAAIYISGDFEGWTGGQEKFRLTEDNSGLYSITLPARKGAIAFKFTRGSWATVEKGKAGAEIPNRVYVFGDSAEVVDLAIEQWAASGEDGPSRRSTASANVRILKQRFPVPQLDTARRIWIYVPPGYDTSQDDYPVLYMHDGQNLFDDATSYAGEWGVDETLNALYDSTGFGLIVVGIDHGGAERIDEYSPWVSELGGGDGEKYIDFLVETLKPYIDSTFRTQHGVAHTGLMGSSMGGLISHYGGVTEPDVFGLVGVFSPSFMIFDSCYTYTNTRDIPDHMRFYFVAGGRESLLEDVPGATQEMIDTMRAAGVSAEHMKLVIDPEGVHNEEFWRKEFGDAVRWLFGVEIED